MHIEKLPKRKIVMFVIAMLLTNFIIDGPMVYQPILANIYEAFPENQMLVNFYVSFPQAFLLISSLLTPYIMKAVGKKETLIISGIICTVSGVAQRFIDSIAVMTVCNCIYAAANGFVMTGSAVVITDYIGDETLRSRILGYFTAAQTLCVSILNIIAGNMALNGWQNAFHTYWLALLPTLAVLVFVPSDRKNVEHSADSVSEHSGSSPDAADVNAKFGKRFWTYFTVLIVFMLGFYSYQYYISVYVSENSLGDTAYTGYLAGAANVAGMLPGLFLAPLLRKLKNRTPFSSVAICALGFVLMYVSRGSSIAAMCSGVFMGLCVGIMLPISFMVCGNVVPPSKVDQAISYVNAALAIGGFAVPYLVSALMNIFGSFTATFPVYATVMAAAAVVEFISSRKDTLGAEG